jgi:hypothetical protein
MAPCASVCTVGMEGATRDNIHYFEAGDAGARGLDITTAYGGDGRFSFVAFQPDKPVWTGMKL